MTVRIATRQSPLALWQANHVKARLEVAHVGLKVALVPLSTAGDRWLDQPLSAAGGKGLFVKELEEALLDGRADLAVHSMKDVPVAQPAGLAIATLLAGEDPRDAFISNRVASLHELPPGSVVGTSSLRRRSQLLAERPDLEVMDLRGNVGTRLSKLDAGRYDAILLACAGLQRLGEGARIREALAVDRFVPAIGQGVIGIECRADDAKTKEALAPLHHAPSAARLDAERAMNARLGGSCHAPVAGHAVVKGDSLELTGLVGAPDGGQLVKARIAGRINEAAQLGEQLGRQLLRGGAADILRALGIG